MNNYLNIKANKKRIVSKINAKEINLFNKKLINKPKRVYSNKKKLKQINIDKENCDNNILTDFSNLTYQNEINKSKIEKHSKINVIKVKKEQPKEIKKEKVQFSKNTYNNNILKLQKKILPQKKIKKKVISSIPLFKNYIEKTLNSKNKYLLDRNKTKVLKAQKTFSLNNHSKNLLTDSLNFNNKRNNSNLMNSNYYTDINFNQKEKIKSADVSPNKTRKIIKIKKSTIFEEKANLKNNSMVVRHNKKRRGVIKLSIDDYLDKKKDKDKDKDKKNDNNNEKIIAYTERNVDISFTQLINNKNPQIVEEYIDDIFKYLKSIENSCLPKENYMIFTQKDINEKMRKVLVDWLIDVHAKFNLFPETLFLTINIIDRYLNKKSINRKYLQLLGITSMFIAGKYEDIYPPDIKQFLFMTDNAYKREELIRMESDILDKIEFNLTFPTYLRFLEIYKKKINLKEKDFYRCRYFIEIALFDYNCCHFSPSLIAATSIFLNFIIKNNKNKDNKYSEKSILKDMEYDLKEVNPCLKTLIKAIKQMIESNNKYSAIKRKFGKEEFMKVSKEKIDLNHIMEIIKRKN